MAEKKIISINFEIPGKSDDCHNYFDDQSLLDADIVVFKPEDFYSSYDEDNSKTVERQTTHWRKEISTALGDGKTVFVMLGKHKTSQIYTGRNEIKGGKKINYVRDFENYEFLPVKLPEIISKGGSEIVFKNHPAFANFWKEFAPNLSYVAYLNGNIDRSVFVTRTGERPVGGVVKSGNGNLVLIPLISYSEEEFTTKNKKDEAEWTKVGMQFGEKLSKALVGIDRALRSETERTPSPEWVEDEEYQLKEEKVIDKKIEKINLDIESLEDKRKGLQADLGSTVQLKDLLFETGKTLENAVNQALKILGYKSENYNDGTLELDHVILSPEGERFVGECEGKDNSAVSIDKFRQLEENIQSDLQREEIEEPATGILFGNGFRLIAPDERAEVFTDKCITSAKRGTILVRTSDLYFAAKKMKESDDQDYAKTCRETISNSKGGIVNFP